SVIVRMCRITRPRSYGYAALTVPTSTKSSHSRRFKGYFDEAALRLNGPSWHCAGHSGTIALFSTPTSDNGYRHERIRHTAFPVRPFSSPAANAAGPDLRQPPVHP